MDQEKFVSVYIELLNTTLSEAIQKNIVSQAQKRVLEEDENKFNGVIQEKEAHIRKITNELNDARRQFNSLSSQIEETKITTQHLETYKNEILESRKANAELLFLIKQKDDLLLQKDEKLKILGEGPKPVIINKLDVQKEQPPATAPTLETKAEQTKKIKNKLIRDAGSF